MRQVRTVLAGVLATAMIIAGLACAGGEEGTATPTPSPTASPSPTATPSPEPFNGGRAPIEKEGPPVPPVAVLTDVRTESHEGFDRVVFEFRDNMPGYRIEYVEPPITTDGSDLPVEIEGNGFLKVVLHVAQAHDEAGNPTISERDLKPSLSSIAEVEMTGDFEGYVSWVLGLSQKVDFRVSELTGPNRVVVDVAHP
jgi:hypothetical protein